MLERLREMAAGNVYVELETGRTLIRKWARCTYNVLYWVG